MKALKKLSWLIIAPLIAGACGERFLDVKPSQSQRIPASVADYLALLDNPTNNNNPMNIRSSHTLGLIGADEFFITQNQWDAFPTGIQYNYQKNAYTWEQEIYEGGETGIQAPTDFETGYLRILRSNLVLDGLGKMDVGETERQDLRLGKGMALFHRAWNYYNLAQLYCPVYQPSTAAADLGLPLRLTPDPTTQIQRASLAATYDRIVADLTESVSLLPPRSEVLFRPSKCAAYALLARVHLQIGDYVQAGLFADSCLQLQDRLIDFNGLSVTGNYLFPLYGIGNPEVIFVTAAYNAHIYGTTRFNADTSLLGAYEEGDLRRAVYFQENNNGRTLFYGSYYGNDWFFTGLATDEIYLIRAECLAREGNLPAARSDLDHLRKNRISATHFDALVIDNAEELLDLIIAERRKELVLRGTRWEDLRRLNREPRYRVELARVLGDRRFELREDSPRWVWPFPVEAIRAGGYAQNER